MPSFPIKSDRLQRELAALEKRDFQLWSLLGLLSVLLIVGLAILILPKFLGFALGRWPNSYLLLLLLGLLVLVLLLNAYLYLQRRSLQKTREALIGERVRCELAETMAVIDPLTDTYNRRYMEHVIAKEMSRAERQGTGLVFVMIDVDDFKTVNTRFGHVVGDNLLCEVAALMKRSFRLSDTIVRYGGDEFLVMLSGATEREAQRALVRLQQNVDEWNRKNSFPGYTLRLSCGLTEYKKNLTFPDLVAAADRKMYACKVDRMMAPRVAV